MTFAASNYISVRYVAEVTFGTTPASPALQELRLTDESLNYNIEFERSNELRADRATTDTILVGASADGSINGEFSYSTWDDFIESALFSTWQTTGSALGPATTLAIVKTGGTPNTWAITDSGSGLAANSWVVGQVLAVTGFAVAGTFYAEITSIAAGTIGIKPLTNVASESAGDSVTLTPLNYIRNGVTKKSFTLQKGFTDLSTVEYYNFVGSVVDSWNLNLATRSILTTSFGFIALNGAMTETQFASATTPAANTNDVLNAVSNISAITFDGDPGGTTFSFNSLDLNIANNVRGQEAVGTLGFVGVVGGRCEISGSMELYFEDSTLYDKFAAATAFELTFMAMDASGNYYIVNLPKAKLTSAEIVAGGSDEDIFVSSEFEALLNTAGTHMIQVSRS